MKAVGPRQTACRLLPVHITAKMLTGDNDDDDDDVDNDYSDVAVSADDEYDSEAALRRFPHENPRHP